MKPLGKPTPLLFRLDEFAGDRSGISAVEFALLLPFMLLLYLGGVSVGDGLAIARKATITVHTVADLATQYTTIYNADMSNILGASSAVVAPYSTANIQLRVSEVTVDANNNATVTWSDQQNWTARPIGQNVTLPSQIATPNTTLIWGEVIYNYTPNFGYVITGTIAISDQLFLYPRLSKTITRINS